MGLGWLGARPRLRVFSIFHVRNLGNGDVYNYICRLSRQHVLAHVEADVVVNVDVCRCMLSRFLFTMALFGVNVMSSSRLLCAGRLCSDRSTGLTAKVLKQRASSSKELQTVYHYCLVHLSIDLVKLGLYYTTVSTTKELHST